METINIRTTTTNDWKTIQSLNNYLFLNDKPNDEDLDMDWPFSNAGIKYYKSLASGDYGKCFIAEVEDVPVGYIALAIKDFGYRTGKHIELENIGVLPEYRSKGFGRLLLEKGKEWGRSIDADKMYVSAYWRNTKAIEFYKREDFEPLDIGLEIKI